MNNLLFLNPQYTRLAVILISVSTLLSMVQGCKRQTDSKLIGEWVEFKIEKFNDSPVYIDMWGDGDSLGTNNSVRRRWEFMQYGKGRDRTLPDEEFHFSYKFKENYLFLDDLKHVVEKLTKDTLIILVPEQGLIDFDTLTPYEKRIHFKKIR